MKWESEGNSAQLAALLGPQLWRCPSRHHAAAKSAFSARQASGVPLASGLVLDTEGFSNSCSPLQGVIRIRWKGLTERVGEK